MQGCTLENTKTAELGDMQTLFMFAGHNPNYPAIAEHCNLWRNFDDISDSWEVANSHPLSLNHIPPSLCCGSPTTTAPMPMASVPSPGPDSGMTPTCSSSAASASVLIKLVGAVSRLLITFFSGSGPDGYVVYARRPPYHVRRLENHSARVQGDLVEQGPYQAGPGTLARPRAK